MDWLQTRVAFVSPGFTGNQREATNFKDIAIELWEVKQYTGGIIVINQIKKSNAAENIKTITDKNKELQEITKEIKVYTEEDFLQNKSDDVIELYEIFKNAILSLSPDIEIKPQKCYIAFKKDGFNVSDIEIQKKGIKISVNLKKGQLDDPKQIMRDMSALGHYTNGDYEVKVTNDNDLQYIMSLVKQAL